MTVVVLLVCLNVWAYGVMSDSREEAVKSASEIADCRVIATHLKSMLDCPTLAATQPVAQAELGPRIERSAAATGIPLASLVRITPTPARRVGETSYRELATDIVVEHVSLLQCVRFLYAITLDQPSMRVSVIHLLATHGRDTADLWTLEATVASLEYAPRETKLLAANGVSSSVD